MWDIYEEFLEDAFIVTSLDFTVILVLMVWDHETSGNVILSINIGQSVSSKHLEILSDCFVWSTMFLDHIKICLRYFTTYNFLCFKVNIWKHLYPRTEYIDENF